MSHRIEGVEFARLTSLYRYGVLDKEADPAITCVLERLAAHLDVPVVQLGFADVHRIVATSSVGPVETCHLRAQGPFEALLNGGPDFVVRSAAAGPLPQSAIPLFDLAALRITSCDDEAIGVLYVADTKPRAFGNEVREALVAAAADICSVLENGRRSREDAKTGALQRESFLDQAQRLIDVSRAGRQWISLVTLNLASFRAALEAKAPGLGSLTTRLMADLGRLQVRRRDTFGRLDSDQFAILLTDTGEAGAHILAKRLARHLERGWTDAGLTTEGIELGVATLKPTMGTDTLSMLLDRTSATKTFPMTTAVTARVA